MELISKKRFAKIYFLIFILIFSGDCYKKKRITLSKHNNYSDNFDLSSGNLKIYKILSDQVRARLYDIPIISECQDIVALTDEDQSEQAFFFTTAKSVIDIKQWLNSEMELWGWDKIMACSGDEHCIVYEKPAKVCSIVISQAQSAFSSSLFYRKQPSNICLRTVKVFVAFKKRLISD